MIDVTDPAWWATIAGYVVTILAGFGIVSVGPDQVRAVLSAVGPLVGAIYVHETHATRRNQDTAAAAVSTAHAQVAAANAHLAAAQLNAGGSAADVIAPPITGTS